MKLLETLASSRHVGQYFADLSFGLENLLMHKLRSLLTMLGMIFGVAAVIAMLSIGAGARQQVMALIEFTKVRYVLVMWGPVAIWTAMGMMYIARLILNRAKTGMVRATHVSPLQRQFFMALAAVLRI